jgi:hypothetical protein
LNHSRRKRDWLVKAILTPGAVHCRDVLGRATAAAAAIT